MDKKIFITVSIFLFLVFCFTGCEKDYPEDIWQPDAVGLADPVINSVDPPDKAFEGISIITLDVSNASSNMAENIVSFNGVIGMIIADQSDQNRLVVKVPVVIEDEAVNSLDSVRITLAAQGAYDLAVYPNATSTVQNYQLEKAAVIWGDFKGSADMDQNPRAVACDRNENIYVSTYDGAAKAIYIVDPNGTQSFYSTATASVVTGMVMGPGDSLYYARKYKYIYVCPPGTGTSTKFNTTGLPNSGKAFALDFDQNGILFAAGKGSPSGVFSLTRDATPTASNEYDDFELVTCKVYDGYLYVGGIQYDALGAELMEGIWKSAITGTDGTLGTRELVFDWSNHVGVDGPELHSILIDEYGKILIGSAETYSAGGSYTGGTTITVLDPSSGATEPLYESVLFAPATHMVWGNSIYLYVSRHTENLSAGGAPEKKIIRVALDRNSAPYYGRVQ